MLQFYFFHFFKTPVLAISNSNRSPQSQPTFRSSQLSNPFSPELTCLILEQRLPSDHDQDMAIAHDKTFKI